MIFSLSGSWPLSSIRVSNTAFRLLPIFLLAASAPAAIVQVYSSAELAPNTTVNWTQLGAGTNLGPTFNATSTNGLGVTGSFDGAGGYVCNGSDPCFAGSNTLLTTSVGVAGTGTGPITFTFANPVSRVGLEVNSILQALGLVGEHYMEASLTLYDGSTFLGQVGGGDYVYSDAGIYLGAISTNPTPNITRAVVALSFAESSVEVPTGRFVYRGPNCNDGRQDPTACQTVNTSHCNNHTNVFSCLRKFFCQSGPNPPCPLPFVSAVNSNDPFFLAKSPEVEIQTVQADLASLQLGRLDLVGAPASSGVPEPRTLHLMGAAGVLLAGLLHRRIFRRPESSPDSSPNAAPRAE